MGVEWIPFLFILRSFPVSHYCSTHVSPIPTLLSSSFKFSWEVCGNTVSFQQCTATKWQPVAKVGNSKGSPYSIAECRVPELIPVLGSQPAGDVSHKPGGRLPLLSAKACSYPPQPVRGLLPVSLLGEQRLRFEPGLYCAWVQHANHSATEPPSERTGLLQVALSSVNNSIGIHALGTI